MTTAPVQSITDVQLAELESKAKEATPGQWGRDGYFVCPARAEAGTTYVESWRPAAEARSVENARFIAAANPATILALIATIRELTAAVPRWISVDDRLPVDGDEVIVSGWAYNDPAQGRYVSAAIFRDGGFHPMDAQDGYDNLHPVTHWMPLPAAPAVPAAAAQEPSFQRLSILKDVPVSYAAHTAPVAAEQQEWACPHCKRHNPICGDCTAKLDPDRFTVKVPRGLMERVCADSEHAEMMVLDRAKAIEELRALLAGGDA